LSDDSSTQRDTRYSGSVEKLSALDLAPPATPSKPLHADSALGRWTHRIAVLFYVSICAVFGVLLVILPWTPKWTDNYILVSYPVLRGFLENGFVRGVCTGLGAVDIWFGFSEAMHYHEKENPT
jgi:hypothetical protein